MDEVIKHLAEWGIAGLLTGALLWLLWYRETISLPRIFDRFSQEMANERTSCEKRHEELLVALQERATRAETMHEENLAAFKEQRHAIKDLAWAARLQQILDSKKPPAEDQSS